MADQEREKRELTEARKLSLLTSHIPGLQEFVVLGALFMDDRMSISMSVFGPP